MSKLPFNGNPIITSKFTNKHRGIDYALSHRTAIIATYSGVVTSTESDISKKTGGIRSWIANTQNDPYKKQLGKVLWVRPLKTEDYGNYIKLKHGNGIETLYAHLDEVLVYEGQWINKGQLIGFSDSSGNSTGGHLHYELRRNGVSIDPDIFDQENPLFVGIGNDKNYTFYPYKGKISVAEGVRGLNVRKQPSVKGELVKQPTGKTYLKDGDYFEVQGFVKGERVTHGDLSTQFWWVSSKGNYVWAGGTKNIPSLDNYPEEVFRNNNLYNGEEVSLMEELKQRLNDLEVRRDELSASLKQVEDEYTAKIDALEDELSGVEEAIEDTNDQLTEVTEPSVEEEVTVVEDVEEDSAEEVEEVVEFLKEKGLLESLRERLNR